MSELLIQLLPLLLFLGYSALVVWFYIIGCDKWWEPLVFAAISPVYFIYQNRTGILLFIFCMVAIIFFPTLIGKSLLFLKGIFQ